MDYENSDPLDIRDGLEEAGDVVEAAAEYIHIDLPVTALKLEGLSSEQLRQYAEQEGIDLGGAKSDSKIIRIIAAAKAEPVEQPVEADAAPDEPQFTLASLYEHMPPGFLERLTQALHARGLVEPGDYFKAGASERFRSAVLSVIRHDFSSAQALAKDAWVKQAEGKAGSK